MHVPLFFASMSPPFFLPFFKPPSCRSHFSLSPGTRPPHVCSPPLGVFPWWLGHVQPADWRSPPALSAGAHCATPSAHRFSAPHGQPAIPKCWAASLYMSHLGPASTQARLGACLRQPSIDRTGHSGNSGTPPSCLGVGTTAL